MTPTSTACARTRSSSCPEPALSPRAAPVPAPAGSLEVEVPGRATGYLMGKGAENLRKLIQAANPSPTWKPGGGGAFDG